jgi:hypothetical protein
MARALGLVSVLLLSAVIASAQTPPRVEQLVLNDNALHVVQESVGNAQPADVIERMLAFDADRDGRVTAQELPERMQPLVARGDADHDNALDLTEIRSLAYGTNTLAQVRQFVHPGGGYGFADEDSVSSLSHVVGALDDLRLASTTQEKASPIVTAFAEALDADAQAELLRTMEPLLSTAQAADLRNALDPRNAQKVFFSANAKQAPQVLMVGANLARRVDQYQLAPAPREQAVAALERFKNRLRINESDRSALLAQMDGILSAEERDDFRAALERRPVTKAGGLGFVFSGGAVVGGTVNGIVRGAPIQSPVQVTPAILVK